MFIAITLILLVFICIAYSMFKASIRFQNRFVSAGIFHSVEGYLLRYLQEVWKAG